MFGRALPSTSYSVFNVDPLGDHYSWCPWVFNEAWRRSYQVLESARRLEPSRNIDDIEGRHVLNRIINLRPPQIKCNKTQPEIVRP